MSKKLTEKKTMKQTMVCCILVLFTVVGGLAQETAGAEGKPARKLVGGQLTFFPQEYDEVQLLEAFGEYFLSKSLSLKVSLGATTKPAFLLTGDLLYHIYPTRKKGLTEGSLGIMFGGGIAGFLVEDIGAQPSVVGGVRYFLTEKAGLFATVRWIFGDLGDIGEAEVPFFTIGICFKLR